MGSDKATLRFGPETLLERVVRIVSYAVADVVVVARPGQDLPELPGGVRVVRDETLDRGPLGGLAPGLRASRADAVFAVACDAPFVRPAVVRLLFERLGEGDAAIAETEGFLHPLCAVYRTRLADAAASLLAADRLRPIFLLEGVPHARVGEEDLRRADAGLDCLRNCNTPETYAAALADRRPLVDVELFDVARKLAGRERARVDAATLGEALSALGEAFPEFGRELARPRHWRFSIGAERFVDDPATPLADADSLLVLSAQAGG